MTKKLKSSTNNPGAILNFKPKYRRITKEKSNQYLTKKQLRYQKRVLNVIVPIIKEMYPPSKTITINTKPPFHITPSPASKWRIFWNAFKALFT